jgi:hypothetical protein
MVRIKEAWIGAGRRYDTPGNRKIGKPKTTTSYRSVPLAPACVAEVRAYLEFAYHLGASLRGTRWRRSSESE